MANAHSVPFRPTGVKPLHLQVVHAVVRVVRRRVAGAALRLAEEQLLALHLRRVGPELLRVELAVDAQAGRRREGNRIVDFYELRGSFGVGEGYDIATDARAATRLTHEVMQRGAAAIAAAAPAKKSAAR